MGQRAPLARLHPVEALPFLDGGDRVDQPIGQNGGCQLADAVEPPCPALARSFAVRVVGCPERDVQRFGPGRQR